MRNWTLFLTFVLFLSNLSKGQELTAEDILDKAIAFHDPSNEWFEANGKFEFREERPDGSARQTLVEFDNKQGFFQLNRDQEQIHGVVLDSCFIIKGEADCDRAKLMRNYYMYLWGLPMKLTDPGTNLDKAYTEEELQGVPTYVLRIAYEKDTWYYYIRKDDFALIAYKFYQDKAETKGELITTDGVFQYGALRLPNKRSWYTIPDNRLLGTDILVVANPRQ